MRAPAGTLTSSGPRSPTHVYPPCQLLVPIAFSGMFGPGPPVCKRTPGDKPTTSPSHSGRGTASRPSHDGDGMLGQCQLGKLGQLKIGRLGHVQSGRLGHSNENEFSVFAASASLPPAASSAPPNSTIIVGNAGVSCCTSTTFATTSITGVCAVPPNVISIPGQPAVGPSTGDVASPLNPPVAAVAAGPTFDSSVLRMSACRVKSGSHAVAPNFCASCSCSPIVGTPAHLAALLSRSPAGPGINPSAVLSPAHFCSWNRIRSLMASPTTDQSAPWIPITAPSTKFLTK